MPITKIISGGQTGADQAALDAAIELGIPHGGWIPKGRLTERGHLSEAYKLKEMPTGSYPKRTEQNILDSDGTLIISYGKLAGGSALTRKLAKKHDKPCLHIDLNTTSAFAAVKTITYWLSKYQIEILNVAGPRLSKDPRIYDEDKIGKIIIRVLTWNPFERMQGLQHYAKTGFHFVLYGILGFLGILAFDIIWNKFTAKPKNG